MTDNIPTPLALALAAVFTLIYIGQCIVQRRESEDHASLLNASLHCRTDDVPQHEESERQHHEGEDDRPEEVETNVGVHARSVSPTTGSR